MSATIAQQQAWHGIHAALEAGKTVKAKFFWSHDEVVVSAVKQGDWGEKYLIVPNGTVSITKLDSWTAK